jgi:hypothetical protein
MPSLCWFGRRRLKQHWPGLITGPCRLVINQCGESGRWQNSGKRRTLSVRAALNCSSPGSSQNSWKTAASWGFTSSRSIQSNLVEVWCTATRAGAGLRIKRAGSATSSSMSLIKTCRRACGSSGTTSLLLASGCLLKTASASRTTGSLRRKNRTLLAMT